MLLFKRVCAGHRLRVAGIVLVVINLMILAASYMGLVSPQRVIPQLTRESLREILKSSSHALGIEIVSSDNRSSSQRNASIRPNTSHRPRYVTPTCTEQHKVAFLKVHKAGSTTILNLLERFGEARNLLFAMPTAQSQNYIGAGGARAVVSPQMLIRIPPNVTYDILFNHVVYSRESFHLIMPPETKYIAIVRHPFSLLQSAIEYLVLARGHFYVKNIPEPDRVKSYLMSPEKYEPKSAITSYTRNTMSFDFGINSKMYTDMDYVKKFVAEKLSEFDLIMVLEHFTESLVLLRRLMCWTTKDVIYLPSNKNKKRAYYTYNNTQKEIYKNFSTADHMLYDAALGKLQRTISSQKPEFFAEVEHMNDVVKQVRAFCDSKNASLTMPRSEWSPAFSVTLRDCEFMTMRELLFLDYSRSRMKKQIANMKKKG